jgi:hypothetical protein
MIDARQYALAAVEREFAEHDALAAAIAEGLYTPKSRKHTRASVVFSVRLSHEEMAALDRKAVAMGLKPSVLARNLVRIGLHAGNNPRPPLAATAGRHHRGPVRLAHADDYARAS